ncbi:MAG: hypothetical protein M3R25_08185 [Bacteroidota bacterium]|nr:hypothetical protein [Bacteroidota bacterium]
MNYLKHLIKKYFQHLWLKSRYSSATQVSLRQIFNFYQLHSHQSDKLNLKTTGFRVFSQFEEDGKILFILAAVGIHNASFIEIGSDDGLNSNCANLAINFGWHGLFIDGNKRSISRGQYFYDHHPIPFGHKPVFAEVKVTRENINEIIARHNILGEVDVLSIDIDGNDYWIWDALTIVSPRVVIIETQINYDQQNIVVPYDAEYSFPGKHPQYHGASPEAMVKLGNKKGYRLIGANDLGFNFIFLRNDLGNDVFPQVSVGDVLTHPSCVIDKKNMDPAVLKMPFVTPIP